MKKIIVTIFAACMVLMMQSCYQSTVVVGDMTADEPSLCVHTIRNAHFLDGLINPENDFQVQEYVKGREAYKVKHYRSFLDGLLSSVTCGVYTPSTVKIYIPMKKK